MQLAPSVPLLAFIGWAPRAVMPRKSYVLPGRLMYVSVMLITVGGLIGLTCRMTLPLVLMRPLSVEIVRFWGFSVRLSVYQLYSSPLVKFQTVTLALPVLLVRFHALR